MDEMKTESVWDYPRPPRIKPCALRVRVEFNGMLIADSTNAWRLLETSHPPSYYIPPSDVRVELLSPTEDHTFCEYKGRASYWNLTVAGSKAESAAWSYPSPTVAYQDLKDHLAFYAHRVDACFVGEERVRPQQGGFYGGWITSNLKGPFKGVPGSRGW